MFNNEPINYEALLNKWAPVLDHKDLPTIGDNYRRRVTAVCLENTEKFVGSEGGNAGFLSEDAPANNNTNVQQWNPILISMIRRSMPNLIAYDLCGVQPMSGPTGLVFAMRTRYTNGTGPEAFYNEADTDFTGAGTHANSDPLTAGYTTGTGMTTAAAEALGTTGGGSYGEMAFSIEKLTASVTSRALKAQFSNELAQDLRAIHGMDAESELGNILSTEVTTELNRELIRTIYGIAKPGAVDNTTAGVFDIDVDGDGRWFVEKIKCLMFQIEREANKIARETRRGRGNMIVTDSDVASALAMAGLLDYGTNLLGNNIMVDDTGPTFAGILNGRYRVYVDPYLTVNATTKKHLLLVGYRGASAIDAGLFYCPYVPMQTYRTVDPQSFNPILGVKTRYALLANPFAQELTAGLGALTANANCYYRKVAVTGIESK